jgi:hypothetical protein
MRGSLTRFYTEMELEAVSDRHYEDTLLRSLTDQGTDEALHSRAACFPFRYPLVGPTTPSSRRVCDDGWAAGKPAKTCVSV